MKYLQRLAAAAADMGPDCLMVAGAGAIAAGAGQIYGPAGWIVAGGFLLAAGLMWAGSRR